MESKSLNKMVHLLNNLASGNLVSNNVTEYYGKSIALKGSAVHSTSNNLYLTVRDTPENIAIIKSEENLRIKTLAQIQIPTETLAEKDLGERRFFSYAFKDDRFFEKTKQNFDLDNHKKHQKVQSIIMSLKFINKSIKELEHPIQLKFKVFDLANTNDSECSFWKKGMLVLSTFF